MGSRIVKTNRPGGCDIYKKMLLINLRQFEKRETE